QADGSANASASLGLAPYTYLWDDDSTQVTPIATGLLAGGYTVIVTDSNGCAGTTTVTVSDSVGPTAAIGSIFLVSCPGGNDGEMTATATDGDPPYTFLWDDGSAQTTATVTGLPVGTYSVLVTDANGCVSSISDVITGPVALSSTISPVTNILCNGSCNGDATVSTTGGTSPYTYVWNDLSSQTTALATGLCAGTYVVQVLDGASCPDSATVIVTEPTVLTSSLIFTATSCNLVCDGTASVSASGGVTPYTYLWDDPSAQTTGTAGGLCAGLVTATVTDANGCVSVSNIAVTEPVALTSNIIQEIGVDCFGDCDGVAEVAPSGGTAPYTFLWSDGQSSALAINLCAGTYTVNITDANGCTVSDTAIITEPADLVNVFSSLDVDCNGNATGTATATVSGGTAPYTYLWDDLGFQTNAIATGLIAGGYCVQVTDSNGCSINECMTITEPVAIAIVIDTTGANCGLADGSACVTVSAGVAPFTYLWNDPSNQTTACATGIASGTYDLTVTDNTGCTALGLAVVSDLGAPTLVISAQGDASCNLGCDGFATVLITNGLPPFTYSWNDTTAQTTALATGLCAGTYVVSILDSNGCTGNIAVTISEPPALNVIISSQIDATCNGDCDGSATGLAAGGTPPYTYQWNDVGTQTTAMASSLCAGVYGLTLIDANGCTDTVSVTIGQPALIVPSVVGNDAHCSLADGSATVTVTGGNGLNGFLWDDGQNTATAINLLAGTYNVVVTDILGCSQNISVVINDLPAGVATISSAINVSCNGGNDGSATVSMGGGRVPFTYSWNDPAFQTTSTATGLVANTYNVNVTDSFGCVVTASVAIADPPALTLTTVADSVTCNGICDGSATVTGIGGTLPYTYLWNDPLAQTNDSATGLCLGVFTVTVTDNKGCIVTATQVVDEPASISLSEFHSDANCQQSDGIATVTVTGGTSPYTYLWSNGATTAFINNISAGTYIVTVTDVNGCVQTLSVTIADIAGPVASIIVSGNATCYGVTDGFATVSVIGGTPPFVYLWNPSAQVAPTAANLGAGIYTVSATDTNNCVASASVTITQPDSIIFNPSLTDPTCFGDCDGDAGVSVAGGTAPYTYSWNDPAAQTTALATGLCSGIYSVNIADNNNCPAIGTFGLTDPLPMTATSVSTDELCLGSCDGTATVSVSNGTPAYTYLWDDPAAQGTPTAAGLCAGNFNVTITDGNGCFTTSQATVGSPPVLVASIANFGNVSCFGYCDGFAQSTATGGTPPYSYLWDDGQTAAQAVGLCAGAYVLTVTDGNGCTATTNVIITEPQGMVVTTSQNNVTCYNACDGNATASLSGGTPPFTYLWDDVALQSTSVANNLCNGIYNVSVTDNNGCVQTASVVITQPQQLGLVPTVVQSTCGFNNGSACVNIIGGITPFLVQWDDPATTVGLCANNLFAGVYNPIVSDGNGCFFTMPVIVSDITGPTVDSITWTDVTCAGDSNGTATIVATGVANPLTYFWKSGSDTIGTGITTVFGLWGGTYSITIVDNNGCIAGASVTINEPAAVAAAIITTNGASCFGICDGSSTVLAGGGTTPYGYAWTDGQTTATATGLCAGSHNVFITDDNGCMIFKTVVIIEPGPLAANDSIIPVSCAGDADGAIYLNVTGGTPFFIYGWTPNVGSGPIVTNLSAICYTVNIQDINGCILNEIYCIPEPWPLVGTPITTPSFCTGANGEATVVGTGGTTPYTYLWPDGQTTPTATNLVAGVTYNFELSDANGCMVIVPVTVTDQPAPAISISAQGVDCNGFDDGTATVVIDSLGAPIFTYQWDDPLAQNTPTAGALVGDMIYNVMVTDANGCTATLPVYVSENPPLTIIASPVDTICYGEQAFISVTGGGGLLINDYFYTWSNGVNTQSQWVSPDSTTTYTVYIDDEAGCRSEDTLDVEVVVHPQITLTATSIPVPNCEGDSTYLSAVAGGGMGGPYTYDWTGAGSDSDTTIFNLPLGVSSFTITVSDACPQDSSITLDITVHPSPDYSISVSGEGCEPFVLTTVAGSGGNPPVTIVSWLWDFDDGFTSTEPDQTTHLYTQSGSYDVSLVIISDMGCVDTVPSLAPVNAYGLPVAGFDLYQGGVKLDSPHVISILTPTIDFVNVSDSVVAWFWDFGDSNSTDNNSILENPSHMYNDTGTYTIMQVVMTADSCFDTTYKEVTIEGDYIIFAPNAFTPDGDGDNDYFFPKGIGVDGQSFRLFIFDRWGDLIATVEGVWSDDITIGWDGRANFGQSEAQIDVYVWLIQTEDFRGDAHGYVGHVTLLR
ncbi:MAG: gliding motility-associated C-terminal domain-containing protein, partial [Nitrospinaceae bacterium]|nr:gliding motility-associated C-terminal domain-containing protein [Nitrospinaceae bacterium]